MLNASSTALYVWLTILGVLVIAIAVFVGVVPINVWIRAMVSGAHISALRLIGMKLRHIEVGMLVDCFINAKKAGVQLTIDDLETHYMAGGNVERVVDALITAHGAKIELSVETAKAIDLANRDILAAVKQSVNPVVITTPEISAVAKDGIELRVKARVTVQSNINKLIGGAGEDTIIARVGEGIVTTVGSAETHEAVLENPDLISKTVLDKGLDSGTAFNILSIDIADIDVGRNIGAKLQAERAEADMQIAQAKAEERRAMAIAAEQEMRAKTQEMRANLLNAESEVPKAISTAFSNGQIGVLDYYKMQNILADTNMRNSLSGGERRKRNTTDKD
ncbi:MAG: flotillin-like protein FloA [Clostridia bacterium]|nr:flotillin-like protein FloA [Clostridia bacterium]MBQ3494464.1 flotillin-like protein FloA [Clostridia bacterium]